jgi:simple sugar transport system ATP-binding protein
VAAPQPLLELHGLGKRFAGILANDAIDLALYPGEVHALLGENGAGKSTLVSMLGGLLKPDAGSIRLDGSAIALASPATARTRGIGLVAQHPTLTPTLTVAENLVLGEGWGLRRPDRDAAAAWFAAQCTAFGLAVDPSLPAGRLSLGEQQLVEILRALRQRSRVLLLDEPTAMLTQEGVGTLLAIMRRATADGAAVLFVTHKLDEALDVAARITVLRHGRVVGRFGPEQPADRGQVLGAMFGGRQATSLSPRKRGRKGDVAILSVQNLTLASPALNRISFSVDAGEIVGIAGIDGNGQTALAEILAGQRAADSGSIRLDGADIEGRGVAARQRLGLRYVTDDRLGEGTVGAFPVALNLLLKRIGDAPFWRHGLARPPAMAAHAEQMIRAHDIRAAGPWAPADTLSGGNVQRLLLARELDGAPRLVIYNKPTHGLDAVTQAATRQRILAQAEAGVAGLLISPDLDELLLLADRIFVMRDGRLYGPIAGGDGARHAAADLMAGGA